MARDLTFDQIDTTEDGELAVVKGELQDTESTVVFMVDRDDGCIRVHVANSNYEGDMAIIIDEIVGQTGLTEVRFMNPIEQDTDGDETPLFDRLDGFEVTTESFEDADDAIEYVGEWEP